MTKFKRLFFLTLVFFLFGASTGSAWTGEVLRVTDGDTIVIKRNDTGGYQSVRLYGIDCPEQYYRGRWESQPYSRVATNFVKGLLAGENRKVTIVETGISYERIVGVIVELKDGRIVQDEIMHAGLGWVDWRYCRKTDPKCQLWAKLQKEARINKIGLWQEEGPIFPWKWRERDK